jgi:hypothetical protein
VRIGAPLPGRCLVDADTDWCGASAESRREECSAGTTPSSRREFRRAGVFISSRFRGSGWMHPWAVAWLDSNVYAEYDADNGLRGCPADSAGPILRDKPKGAIATGRKALVKFRATTALILLFAALFVVCAFDKPGADLWPNPPPQETGSFCAVLSTSALASFPPPSPPLQFLPGEYIRLLPVVYPVWLLLSSLDHPPRPSA